MSLRAKVTPCFSDELPNATALQTNSFEEMQFK